MTPADPDRDGRVPRRPGAACRPNVFGTYVTCVTDHYQHPRGSWLTGLSRSE